jgi:hypothetical protein
MGEHFSRNQRKKRGRVKRRGIQGRCGNRPALRLSLFNPHSFSLILASGAGQIPGRALPGRQRRNDGG